MGARILIPTSTSVTTEDLVRQFMSHAEATLTFHGLSLEPDGKTALELEFSGAARVMAREQRTSSENVGQAHHAVGIYTQRIVLETRAANVASVNASIVQRVKNFFCPGLWPIC